MTKILFIGSFLSIISGTSSVSENLCKLLKSPELEIKLKSSKQSKIARLLEIIVSSFFFRFEVIHIDTFSGQAFIITEVASIIGRIRRKRVILTLHGGKLPEYFLKSPNRVRRVLSRTDYIQTPSLYLRDFFVTQKISVNYLPNSIDLSKFAYSRENVKCHTLLWVRAFTEIYNPNLAIRILHEVKKTYPDTTLTMIGPDKGLLSETRKLINKLKLNSSVIITGPVSNDQLSSYYHTHEVFLNTTSYESFGVAVMEAAACGIPVISSNVGEIPYIWKDEENILMINSLNEDDYCQAVKRIFESKEFSEKISLNARVRAEKFDWEIIRSKWIDLLT